MAADRPSGRYAIRQYSDGLHASTAKICTTVRPPESEQPRTATTSRSVRAARAHTSDFERDLIAIPSEIDGQSSSE